MSKIKMRKVKKGQKFNYLSFCQYMNWDMSEYPKERCLELLGKIASYHIEDEWIFIDKAYRKPKSDNITMIVLSMSQDEYEDFDKVYRYIQRDLMEYVEVDGQKKALPFQMVLRIKGLRKGQHYLNYNGNELAEYTYDVILATLKLYTREIKAGFSKMTFRNEMHKFNYMMKIVESHINDVIDRIHHVKQEKTKKEVLLQENKSVFEAKIKFSKYNYTPKHKKIRKELEELM